MNPRKERCFYGTTGRRTGVQQQQQAQVLVIRMYIVAMIIEDLSDAKKSPTENIPEALFGCRDQGVPVAFLIKKLMHLRIPLQV